MPVYSYITQLGISSNNPVDARFDFRRANIGLVEEHLNTNGIRGTRSPNVARVRQGIRRVQGQLSLQPTAVELAALLPWILGANASGTTYALANVLQKRYVTVARDDGTDGKVFTYDNVAVSRAVFRGQQGMPIDLELDLVGVDETVGNAGTFPSLSIDTTTGPFIFPDSTGALSINSTTVGAPEFEVTIDNMFDAERFLNSLTLSTSAGATGRQITVRTRLPYSDAEALYGTGAGGVAVTWTLTNGGTSLAFSFVKVCFPRMQIEVPERGELFVPLQGQAYLSSSTNELVCTLDSTP